MKPEISLAWASKKIDCTPEGRKVCKGKCCKMNAPMGQGRYFKEELTNREDLEDVFGKRWYEEKYKLLKDYQKRAEVRLQKDLR